MIMDDWNANVKLEDILYIYRTKVEQYYTNKTGYSSSMR